MVVFTYSWLSCLLQIPPLTLYVEHMPMEKRFAIFPFLVKVYVLCTARLYDVYIRPETTSREILRETTAHMYNDTVNITCDHHLLHSSSGLVGQGVLHAKSTKDMYLYCTHMYVFVSKHSPSRSTCILHLAWSVTG